MDKKITLRKKLLAERDRLTEELVRLSEENFNHEFDTEIKYTREHLNFVKDLIKLCVDRTYF